MGRRIEAEDLLAFELVGDVQLSPGGERVAYLSSRVDREKNQYQTSIYMTGPGGEPVRFTGGESDSAPRFSPCGSRLAFLSRRSGQSQVWVIDLGGGEARQLTRIQGGVTEFAWAPDGERLALIALLKADGIQPEVKEEKEEDLFRKHTGKVKVVTELFHKADGIGWFGERRPCLCVIGLQEGAEPLQLTQPPYLVGDLAWSPDSSTIYLTGRIGPEHDRNAVEQIIYAIAATGGEPRPLTPPGFSCGAPSPSPDGSLLAFLATEIAEGGFGNTQLHLLRLADGERTRVAAGWDRTFDHRGLSDMPAPAGGRIRWSEEGARLYLLSSMDGTTQLVSVEIATGGVSTLTAGDQMVYTFSMDERCRRAAIGKASPLSPGDIYYLDLPEGSEEQLTRANRRLLEELDLALPQRFTARAGEGPDVDAWVIPPADRQEGRGYPAVVSIHGGPMMMYASAFFFEFQLLAAQGYGVIYSNPRGSQGYGKEFCAAIYKDWGNRDYADIMAVVDTAVAQYPWIDPDRLGVIGGSYGGYMTNWIIGHTNRFAAAVTGRSICDWRSMSLVSDFGPDWVTQPAGAGYWKDESWYRQQSPITYVENVTTPILIEHQEGDLRCPVDQGMAWFAAIKFLGRAPVKLVVYPEEFHGMSRNGKPWNRIHRLREILAWFGTYLKGEQPQEVGQ